MIPKRAKLPVPAMVLEQITSGRASADLEKYLEDYEEAGQLDIDLIERLFDEGMTQFPDANDHSRMQLDRYLAPRLHYALRLTPRVAGDKGFWAWLAIGPLRAYVRHRWLRPNRDAITAYRFVGDVTRNAIARLWWYAEMARDGRNYSLVDRLFEDAGTLQYAMEAAFSRYRPAVHAFIRVSRGLDGHDPLDFGQNLLLSKRINAYSALRAVAGVGPGAAALEGVDSAWRSASPASVSEVLENAELLGPDDGSADPEAVAKLEKWFRSLVSEGAGE